MKKPTLDLENLITPDNLASEVSSKFQEWKSLRKGWENEKKELRNYLYATDTTTTTNKKNSWSNSTTTPKLTQIYDNLKANYTAALFPNSKWMRWEGDTKEDNSKKKRDVIQQYMYNKLEKGGFPTEVDRIVDDYILYGNCFATVDYVAEPGGFVGPSLVRISPHDIVFNPAASSFRDTPKIVRSILTLGSIKRDIIKGDESKKLIFDKMLTNRREVASAGTFEKGEGYVADGFSSIQHYYGSDYVELLTFYGDIYDTVSGELRERRIITIADRAYVLSDIEFPSWFGHDAIFHAGWRSRTDNLYAMGPLDNLVGLQYRIDHLENLKADVFDQIAFPMLKIRGMVEDFDHSPGTRIVIGEEGDVTYLAPDTTALNADFQIRDLENKMEEMAGAPRQAMGIRTPGEKTAFEVQSLENAAGRIFQHKAAKFEREFVEPVLNAMLEAARRRMDTADYIRVFDDQINANIFSTVTKEDITAIGVLKPRGARHFAERAQRVQNINQLLMLKAGDPTVGVHMSGKAIAKLLAEELGEDNIYGENISVGEQAETQRVMQDTEANMMEELEIAAEEGL